MSDTLIKLPDKDLNFYQSSREDGSASCSVDGGPYPAVDLIQHFSASVRLFLTSESVSACLGSAQEATNKTRTAGTRGQVNCHTVDQVVWESHEGVPGFQIAA
jgi:hypothetical protein